MGGWKRENRLKRVLDGLEVKLKENHITCARKDECTLIFWLESRPYIVEYDQNDDVYINIKTSCTIDQFENPRIEILETINTIHHQLYAVKIVLGIKHTNDPNIYITSDMILESTEDFYEKFIENMVLISSCLTRLTLSLRTKAECVNSEMQ